ncbi:hypothetical protein CPAR01_06530 [Colletotrichum paranaense]|uniref:Uncharacterized protein n=1 Tax=Colletotrichum paranaense TaxID=1914294 RepID=A0ABQ9SLZ7_9PEZI|nr:uncharacterized protein CPAR01_06530 [Colletotrichum paranaense]KAK1540541.1 hypothetical protein CPAR01_06530 [Colletotrichum paranaense]
MMSLTNPPSVASGPGSVRTGTLKRSVQAAFEANALARNCRSLFAPLASQFLPFFAACLTRVECQCVVPEGNPRVKRQTSGATSERA